jgi:hypothetical protein
MAFEGMLQTRIERIKLAPSPREIARIANEQHNALTKVPKTMAGNRLLISKANQTKYAALEATKNKYSGGLANAIGQLDWLVFYRTFNQEAVDNVVRLLKAARRTTGKDRAKLIRMAVTELDRHPTESFYMRESMDLAKKVIREIEKGMTGKDSEKLVSHLNALVKIRAPTIYKINI